MKNRSSNIVKLGRLYQKISPAFSFLDVIPQLTLKKRNKERKPNIFILAAPRSGSTLTYQVLTQAISNIHLTNIWHLLYSTPLLGCIISEKLLRKERSVNFKSYHGFVPGLTGQAEGLSFWNYWANQGLEDYDFVDEIQLKKISKKISLLTSSYDKPFISCYLGHVFMIEELKKFFDNALFIYLKRDILSNAMSIYNVSQDDWFSVKPKGIDLTTVKDRREQIVKQLFQVHKKIYDSADSRFINISYENLCENPVGLVNLVNEFSDKLGYDIDIDLNSLPDKFDLRKINSNSEDSNIINFKEIINREKEKYSSSFLSHINVM